MQKKSTKGGTVDKAREFDFSLLNEYVGVNFQLIHCHSSDFNKFEVPLTDTSLQEKKCSHCEMAVLHSDGPPSNGQQEGQAQSIPDMFFDDAVKRQNYLCNTPIHVFVQLCEAEHLAN